MITEKFHFLCLEIQNYIAEADADHIAEADADLIPVPGESEWHDRCRCGVLLSSWAGASFVTDLILAMGGIRSTLQMQRQI